MVLVNDEGRHSLWPAAMQLPNGWQVYHGEGAPAECPACIEENRTDLRPLSA